MAIDDLPVYEVFWQKDALSFATHVGSVRAASDQAALEAAREAYFRRDSAFDIWVVREDHIARARVIPETLPDAPETKSYRLPNGYDNAPLWKKFKAQAQKIEDVAAEMAASQGGSER
ncbi:phenylacetic acid degradation protein [Sulfobacillus harzensis]|uniref:Phenylacetic acid degradation protein n=1 Tax=Sulfobacillus harzensis TaxID=2729629 RepID=A0A7Y0Q2R1_9FIRM|nr:phenylacetic acid degradation protein [Sulfobacillus harzensis]NMP22802.1 phenylacetic acid degradation protein [Sulfobacillus harzensis]